MAYMANRRGTWQQHAGKAWCCKLWYVMVSQASHPSLRAYCFTFTFQSKVVLAARDYVHVSKQSCARVSPFRHATVKAHEWK
eukprot:6058735-Amphidinium_carterae.1